MKYNYIGCFDLETTGVNPKSDDVIEYSMVIYKKNEEGKYRISHLRFDEFVQTEVDIENKFIDRFDEHGNKMTISSLTHITKEMSDNGLKEKDFVDAFINQVYSLDGPLLLMGYNVNFDLNFMYNKIKKYYPNFKFEKDNVDYLDVMAIYKDFYQYDRSLGHRLDAVVKNLNISVKNTHRSIDDVDATYEAFKALVRKTKTLSPYINVFGYNAKYGYESNIKKIEYIPQTGGSKSILLKALCKQEA